MTEENKPKKLLGYYARWTYENRKFADFFLCDMQAVLNFLYQATEHQDIKSWQAKSSKFSVKIDDETFSADFKLPVEIEYFIQAVNDRRGNQGVDIVFGPVYSEPKFQEINTRTY